MELCLPRQSLGMFQSLLKVAAELHQFSAQGSYRSVLLLAVVMRNSDHCPEPVTHCGESHTLPKVAPGGRDHTFHLRSFSAKLGDVK